MARIEVRNLTRRFGKVTALDGISFDVEEGQFVSLLGPSGCGKSTTLTALAGLDRPTAGRIAIGSRLVFDQAQNVFVDAQFRNLGLMFQSYALWPHMTVEQNVRFPLEVRGLAEAEMKRLVAVNLDLVQMSEYAGRYPGELSGGQQQRVALARTLVYGPDVLLLDEPLSNLDAKLRDQARVWLRDLQRETGKTTIYVTHDQSEALALSDRIFVMSAGRIAQQGTPKEIYESPATPQVADFVGSANLVSARLVGRAKGSCTILLPSGDRLEADAAEDDRLGDDVIVAIRPESVNFSAGDSTSPGDNEVAAEVVDSSYQGARFVHHLRIGEQTLRAESTAPLEGCHVHVRLPRRALRLYAAERA